MKSEKQKPTEEVLGNAVRRWGGFGPFDYAYRYREEDERTLKEVWERMKKENKKKTKGKK